MPAMKFVLPTKVANYHKQMQFIDAPTRYTIVEATTKAGKTVGCIVWLYREACKGGKGDNYWWVAPIYAQAKIAFRRMKRFIRPTWCYKANNSEMSIRLINGVTIFFKSADNPDALYGDDVKALVMDEITRIKEDAWYACRSVVTATQGSMKLIGNVKGIDNWAYRLAREAENGKEAWTYCKITAADAVAAGVLAQAEIEDAERSLPKEIFLELYYAIPFVNSSNKFCYSFDEKKHIGTTKFNPTYPLYLSFDFNRNPICCTAFQIYDNSIYGIETIKLPNSNIYNLCQHIRTKYPNAVYIINGDATGKAGSALVKDNINYYRVIKAELDLADTVFKVPSVNPSIADNQVLVNAILEHYNVLFDPDKCSGLIHDCKFVEMLPDGSIKKGDREDPKQQADALDTFRYFLNTNFKWFLKSRLAA
jgi:hypothetical protein